MFAFAWSCWCGRAFHCNLLTKRIFLSCAPGYPFCKRIFIAIPNASLPRAFFCLDPRRSRTERSYTKETKNASPVRPSASGQWPPDKKLKATSKIGLRAKPLALQARLSRPPMPLFFVVFYDSNLTSRQSGSVY
mgnify:CR=1 FL=1